MPRSWPARYDDFVGMGVGYNLLLHWDYNADTGPTPAGAADFVWQMGDTPLPCLADSGSVTVDYLGMEGELVTGELDLGISESGCPASVTATFSMTVVDGGSLLE